MVALYIAIGLFALIGLIAIILSLYIKIVYKYTDDRFELFVRIGPFKYKIFPNKKEKLRYKRLARRLRGRKISNIRFVSSKKKKKSSNKKDIDIKEFFSDLRFDKMVEIISESTKTPEFTRILLNAAKGFVYDFKHSLHSQIKRIIITVDEKDASSTCIRCGVISQALSYLLEFLNIFTVLELPKEGNIAVVPSFDNSGYKFEVEGKFRIRIISILSAVIKTAFKSVLGDIEKKFM